MMKTTANTEQAYTLFHNGALAFSRAEAYGIRVDVEYCSRQNSILTRRIERARRRALRSKLVKQWQHVYGKSFNINSDYQLAHILYNIRKIKPVKMTSSGKQGTTDQEALQSLGLPELNWLLEARKLTKIRDTYLSAFVREQVGGYLHPAFNLHTVKTFRSSSDGPNFQNIPKRDEEAMKICRGALFPRLGHQLLEVDYSGIEVRIAACYHKDPEMLKYIGDPVSDMHADMAEQLFVLDFFSKKKHDFLRSAAKNGFVFPQFYGDYYGNCAPNLACRWGKLPQQGKWRSGQGIPLDGSTLSDHFIAKGISDLDAFTGHVKRVEDHFWNVRFKQYQQWKEEWWKQYQKRGYIDMFTGFRCKGLMGFNDCINYPIQGSAFHCLLWSFIALDRISQEENWKSRLIGQIHDSILVDVFPPELEHVVATIRRVTCQDLPKAWHWIITPLEIDVELSAIDASWAEKQMLAEN